MVVVPLENGGIISDLEQRQEHILMRSMAI